MISVTASN